ncbi:hypothetical protein M0R45_035954 [Rubus argutus]|uniref:Uncharacterized protein n=1 Tax=Rubus argutus TaxID=59490 RepID=A0AAW1VYU7_RUBAR
MFLSSTDSKEEFTGTCVTAVEAVETENLQEKHIRIKTLCNQPFGLLQEMAGGLTSEKAGGLTSEKAGGLTSEKAGGLISEKAGGFSGLTAAFLSIFILPSANEPDSSHY